MLYGIALQAGRKSAAGIVSVHQVISVPALGVAFSRTISENNPRRQWRHSHFTNDSEVWAHHGVRSDLDVSFDERHLRSLSDWQVTMDVPVLFHVKDDEAVEMRGGEMPRNVALRFQRAVEAHQATLVGAHAWTLHEVLDALEVKHRERTSTLAKAPGDTFNNRINEILRLLDEGIRENKTKMLDNYVPTPARAKGAGPHRNHDNLPTGKTDTVHAPVIAVAAPAAPVAPVPEGAEVKPGDVLTRPNGQPYMCREVRDLDIKGGISDVQLYRTVRMAGVHTLLWGAPGTGKTAGFEVAFPGMVNMLGTPETESDDFYGGYVAVVGEDGREVLHWQDGPLTIAFEQGKVLFVDEIGLIPSNQVAPLLGVLDGRTEFTIPQNPARGTIRRKEGFGVVAAFNPSTARHVSEALISRFGLKIEHTTDHGAARAMGCNPRLVDAAEHMNAQVATGELGWAPQMRELLQARDDEAMFGIVYALRNLAMNAPEMERDLVLGHLRERFGDIPGANRKIKALKV